MFRIGVVSDTHGLLRPETLAFLQGCDHIVHGGDICDAGVLERLAEIAPVTAVRGNNDHGAWAFDVPESRHFELAGVRFYVVHDLKHADRAPGARDVRVVISGHTHKPLIEERDGTLYVNPGSPGPRRFRLPVSVAEVTIDGAAVTARIVELTESSWPSN